jgi:hypothetical protein
MICPCIIYIFLLIIICFITLVLQYYFSKLKKKESYYSTLPEEDYLKNNDRVIAGTVYSSYDVAREDPGLGWVL